MRIISPPIVGDALFGEVALRAVVADRLPLPLPHPQHQDEARPDPQADDQRGRDRRPRTEAQIADEVQNPQKASQFPPASTASIVPIGQRRHDMRQADAVRSLDQHRIAGPDHILQPRGGGGVGGHMLEIDPPLKRFGERRHLFADKQGVHPGRDERSGKRGMK